MHTRETQKTTADPTRIWAPQSAGSWCYRGPCPPCARRSWFSTFQSTDRVCLHPEWTLHNPLQSHPRLSSGARCSTLQCPEIRGKHDLLRYVTLDVQRTRAVLRLHPHLIIERAAHISTIDGRDECQILPVLPLQIFIVQVARCAVP